MNFNEIIGDTVSSVSQAAMVGDVAALKRLLDEGRPSNRHDNRGWKPLHVAAGAGHTQCLQRLIEEEDCDLNWETFEGETALLLACYQLPATKEAVYLLLSYEDVNVNLSENFGISPLQATCGPASQSPDVVKWLVRRGAEVNHSDYLGHSCLHVASSSRRGNQEQQVQIVKYLLKHGANLWATDENRLTPLMTASNFGCDLIVEAILEYCCSSHDLEKYVNLTAVDGATALILATQNGNVKIVKALLEAGADPNKLTSDCVLALHIASQGSRHTEILRILLEVTDLELVYKLGEKNRRQKDFMPREYPPIISRPSPFRLAIEWRRSDNLKLLLQSGLQWRNFWIPASCPIHENGDTIECCGGKFPFEFMCPLSHFILEYPWNPIPEGRLDILKLFLNDTELRRCHSEKDGLPPLLAYALCIWPDEDEQFLKCLLKSEVPPPKLSRLEQRFVLTVGQIQGRIRFIKLGLVDPEEFLTDETLEFIEECFKDHPNLASPNYVVLQAKVLVSLYLSSSLRSKGISEAVRRVHDVVSSSSLIRQFPPNLRILNEIYENISSASTLQSIARDKIRQTLIIASNNSQNLVTLIRQLKLPPVIESFLKLSDLSDENFLKIYGETKNHLSSN